MDLRAVFKKTLSSCGGVTSSGSDSYSTAICSECHVYHFCRLSVIMKLSRISKTSENLLQLGRFLRPAVIVPNELPCFQMTSVGSHSTSWTCRKERIYSILKIPSIASILLLCINPDQNRKSTKCTFKCSAHLDHCTRLSFREKNITLTWNENRGF